MRGRKTRLFLSLDLKTFKTIPDPPTCSWDGAHLWRWAISPAASTVAATLHSAHQLWVLIGAAAVQHTSVAVPATSIWERTRNNAAWSEQNHAGLNMACWAKWRGRNCKATELLQIFPTFGRQQASSIWELFLSLWHPAPAWLIVTFHIYTISGFTTRLSEVFTWEPDRLHCWLADKDVRKRKHGKKTFWRSSFEEKTFLASKQPLLWETLWLVHVCEFK